MTLRRPVTGIVEAGRRMRSSVIALAILGVGYAGVPWALGCGAGGRARRTPAPGGPGRPPLEVAVTVVAVSAAVVLDDEVLVELVASTGPPSPDGATWVRCAASPRVLGLVERWRAGTVPVLVATCDGDGDGRLVTRHDEVAVQLLPHVA